MTGFSIPMDSYPKSSLQDVSIASAVDDQKQLRLFMQQMSGRALVMMETATGQHDVARDLVQESFIALYQHYAQRPLAEWTPLFYTILNHRLMDWHRQETRKQKRFGWFRSLSADDDALHDDPILNVEDEHNIDPADFMSKSHTMEEIKQAISRLPLRQQQAFLLRAWENLDTKTTAGIMDCSEGSVKTHYHRAIQALKQSLSQFDVQ